MVPFLWRYLKKHLPMLTANALLVCAQTYLLVIVLMGQMKNIINLGVEAGDMDYIRSSGVRMLLIILVIGACTVGYSYLSAALTADVIGSIRADLSDRILGLSLQDFGRYGGGIWPMMGTRPMSRGYSRADRMDEVVQAMGGAMNDMPEDLRREAQRFLTKMQQQM